MWVTWTGRWFSPDPPVSSTNKTDLHDITEILLKVALNTIKQTNKQKPNIYFDILWMYSKFTQKFEEFLCCNLFMISMFYCQYFIKWVTFIMYTVQEYVLAIFTTTLLSQLYVKVNILHTCRKHLYDPIISPKREVWFQKTSFTPLYLKCLYQARRVSDHVNVW